MTLTNKNLTVSIIDYGMGNIGSVVNALERISVDTKIVKTKQEIISSQILIFPGVGAFDEAIKFLRKSGLFDFINQAVIKKKIPTLGICLGAQLACSSSTENGFNQGFGWFNAEVHELHSTKAIRVPHVGWNSIKYLKSDLLLKNIKKYSNFYFDHSFCITNSEDTLATSNHGQLFSSILKKDNIVCVQFHPEKSSIVGLQFLNNFINFAKSYL